MATKTNPRRKFNTLTMTVEATATMVSWVPPPHYRRPCGDAIIDVAGIGIGQQA
jgi:hypothetical protein